MSDIRFNRWLHQSGTGGVYQDGSGRVGIGSSTPTEALDIVGVASATSFFGPLTGDVTSSGTSTFDVISGVSTIGVTTVHLTGINNLSYPTAGPLSNRNIVINGGMTVAQRATSTSTFRGATEYRTIDRFKTEVASYSTVEGTVSQSSESPVGFSSSLRINVTTAESIAAGDLATIRYRIEGQDCQQFAYGTSNAKTLTLSFWVRSSITGTYALSLYQPDDARNIGLTYSIDTADTWEYKSLNIPPDTTGVIDDNNGEGLQIAWNLSVGSTYRGTDNTTWGAYASARWATGHTADLLGSTSNFYLTGVQLETGSIATPFEYRSYGDELARCQRYYCKLIADTGDTFCNGYNQNTRNTRNIVHFPVTMRVAPTALEQTGTAANYRILHGTTVTACSGVPVFLSATTNTGEIQADTGSGLTAGQGNALESNSNDTYLAFSAEL